MQKVLNDNGQVSAVIKRQVSNSGKMATGGEHGRKGFDVRKKRFTAREFARTYRWQAVGARRMALGSGDGQRVRHGERRRCRLVHVEVLLLRLPLPFCPLTRTGALTLVHWNGGKFQTKQKRTSCSGTRF